MNRRKAVKDMDLKERKSPRAEWKSLATKVVESPRNKENPDNKESPDNRGNLETRESPDAKK